MLDVPDPNHFEAGDVLSGKYRVERLLGEGGFGRVYAAYNIDLDVPVAIKVRRIPGPDQRLWREAKAGAQICSPFSVRVYDIEQLEDGTPYIVMEHLCGRSLRDYLKAHGTVVPSLAARWVTELCSALGEAHELGQIHRDIKPSNLFLVEQPHTPTHLKLLDFGLTKALNEASDDTLTESGIVLGSPAYMSPEQVRGADVTAQSDIWSMGVVLYEMLTGRRPFEAPTNAAVLAAIAADAPATLREIAPDIPAKFDAIINRCLRKCAGERYPSAAALASDLSDRPASSRHLDSGMSTSVSVTATLTIQDRPGAPTALASRLTWSAVAVVALGAVGLVAFRNPTEATTPPTHAVSKTEPPQAGPVARTATSVRPHPGNDIENRTPPPQSTAAPSTSAKLTGPTVVDKRRPTPSVATRPEPKRPPSHSAALGLFKTPDF